MEVIIITDSGIMIQDITEIMNHDLMKIINPILRVPSVEELTKLANACQKSVDEMNKPDIPKPEITDYVKLREDVLEEIRKQKLDAICKMYPNKRIIVTKDGQVFIEK